jgi:uncharacterized protein
VPGRSCTKRGRRRRKFHTETARCAGRRSHGFRAGEPAPGIQQPEKPGSCDNDSVMSLRFQISDLLAHPGQAREEAAALPVKVALSNASVDDQVAVSIILRSLTDGVVARGAAETTVDLTCNRCLTAWSEPMSVPIEAVFRVQPEDEDDELPVEAGGWIDVEPVVHDEVALTLPTRPVCKPDCLGLCPTCGTDLNTEPCDGHGEESDSPFAALQQLFAGEPSQQSDS